ncbi:orotidine 5'-phosphate decarboxylase [Sulfobacillus thermotolerans]|uniref:Orotidine 5'-phosphate decarboxylase n=2 Tax=Clostridiales Family XVII. Incertae Sedis TaxID=539000 RepID=A0ABM6RW25_9FIRM|nr:orotidine 5'-phosphate decarboxylase [Sulfobacillus thermotolerans]
MWIALDVSTQEEAERLMARFPRHRHYKVGMELFYQMGPQAVANWILHQQRIIFLDLKLHDIPRTVGHAVGQLARIGVSLVTIHLHGGLAMCQEAVAQKGDMDVVGVSVLTSLDQEDLRLLGIERPIPQHVGELTRLALRSGLDGVVTSGEELPLVREIWSDGRFVVPGIRSRTDSLDDQRRVITPEGALQQGATDLVIGRTLTHAENPEQKYEELEMIMTTYLKGAGHS